VKDFFWRFFHAGALFWKRSHMNNFDLGGLFNLQRDFPPWRRIHMSSLELGQISKFGGVFSCGAEGPYKLIFLVLEPGKRAV
jgi:hypothetical protein